MVSRPESWPVTTREMNAPTNASTELQDRPGRNIRSAPRVAVILTFVFLAAALAGWAGYRYSFERALGEIRGNTDHRLDLYAASMEREIDKFAAFPVVVSYDSAIADLAAAPGDAVRLADADRYLERVNASIGTLAVYVLDRSGRCIASSNWDRPDSFVGRDLSYRPYFRNLAVGRIERFYGIGTTASEPGYYLSTALHDGDDIIGAVVVKVSLEQLERSWSSAEAPALLADEHGVVVLSTVPAWKYGALRPIDAKERAEIAQTQQYNERALQPIGMTVSRELDAHSDIVSFAGAESIAADAGPGDLFLAESRPMPGVPWRLTVFSSLGDAVALAEGGGAVAALAAIVVAGATLIFLQRHRHMRDLTNARAALQLAHDNLELTVAERTSELLVVNSRLTEEIEEHSRAERTLREAQAGLIQAGKLAALGQLSAGVAHELNQPLAALATISGNTVKYLDRGDPVSARSNVERIRPLVDRMAKLTGELKSFARKSSGEMSLAPLRRSLDNVLFLLHHRVERGAVVVSEEVDEEALVWCDPNRLEQVLLNLIGNALDAMEGQDQQRLTIRVEREDVSVVIEIRDNGPGLRAELLDHLFEPFYTTKAPGMGLGLGLAISAGIVRDLGGELTAQNAPEGGAGFIVKLPSRKEPNA
jgi:two-component system C4-dicarboxylate transport sensor histidine kinase DctB